MKTPMTRREFLHQCGWCAAALAGVSSLPLMPADAVEPLSTPSSGPAKGFIGRKVSPYFTAIGGGKIRCELCPHQCEVADGERGFCRVRQNTAGQYYSIVYGNPCAVHVDPIEKKPFFHVLPSTGSFSIATAGCNFTCKFCQNWEISQAQPEDTFNYEMSPEAVVNLAQKYQCQSVASTYVEPTIFIEYMLDIGRLCRQKGLLKVIHSNGYINLQPLKDLCEVLDAACIDLKGITEEYYRDMTGGSLKPVQDTLKKLKESGVHTEIVNLVIPTKNDQPEHLKSLSRWIKQELGADTPLHFSRFHPTYKLKSLPPTPVATLEQARSIALSEGLHYVYIGNVPGHPAENTVCPKCQKTVIERQGYAVRSLHLKDGKCEACGQAIAGIWKPKS